MRKLKCTPKMHPVQEEKKDKTNKEHNKFIAREFSLTPSLSPVTKLRHSLHRSLRRFVLKFIRFRNSCIYWGSDSVYQ